MTYKNPQITLQGHSMKRTPENHVCMWERSWWRRTPETIQTQRLRDELWNPTTHMKSVINGSAYKTSDSQRCMRYTVTIPYHMKWYSELNLFCVWNIKGKIYDDLIIIFGWSCVFKGHCLTLSPGRQCNFLATSTPGRASYINTEDMNT